MGGKGYRRACRTPPEVPRLAVQTRRKPAVQSQGRTAAEEQSEGQRRGRERGQDTLQAVRQNSRSAGRGQDGRRPRGRGRAVRLRGRHRAQSERRRRLRRLRHEARESRRPCADADEGPARQTRRGTYEGCRAHPPRRRHETRRRDARCPHRRARPRERHALQDAPHRDVQAVVVRARGRGPRRRRIPALAEPAGLCATRLAERAAPRRTLGGCTRFAPARAWRG